MSAGYYYPDTATFYGGTIPFTPSSFVVGAGQETDGNLDDRTHMLVDFGDDALNITLTSTSTFTLLGAPRRSMESSSPRSSRTTSRARP
jgi:hypothetical protein